MNTRNLHNTKRFLACFALSGLLLAGCSGDPSSPTDPGNGGGDPKPNPDGVFLEGDPSDSAFDATRLLPPSPVEAADILDGLLLTRLTAILNPLATVEEINGVLDDHDARIVTMDNKNVLVTLKIQRVSSRSEAKALARALVESGAFLFASPADTPSSGPVVIVEEGKAARLTPPEGHGDIEHLTATYLPAAWNAKRLALQNNNHVKVLVPDIYYSNTPSAEINAQSFVEDGGVPSTSGSAIDFEGNHGFYCSGIIGANFDGIGPTGTSPDPTLLLDIRSKHITGVASSDYYLSIAQAFPAIGKFVVSTSLGYPGAAELTKNDFINLAFTGLSWRIHAVNHQDRFIHATAAGNERYVPGPRGDARYGSGYNVASMWDNPRSLIPPDSLSTAEWQGFDIAWNAMLAQHPEAANRLTNTLVVGSSDLSGVESWFSNVNSHVRAVGEEVLGPCVIQDPGYPDHATLCDGTVARYSGTSMATPYVAGLAAYLWNLDPSLTPQQLMEKIQSAYDGSRTPGLVDAHQAVLLLDETLASAGVRKSIFDVAGATVESGPNDKFDEVDIETLLLWLEHYELQRSVDGFAYDFSRYDLNGDGITGGTDMDGFDLDLNGGIVGSTSLELCGASPVLEETALTDLDVLKYYAYSSLYQGDTDRRDELLCEGSFVEIVDLPDRVNPTETHTITIRAGFNENGSVEPQEGIAIDIRAYDGTTSVASGTTDANGELVAEVAMREEYAAHDYVNELRIVATAHFPNGDETASRTAIRPNSTQYRFRRLEQELESYFFFDPTPAPGAEIVFNEDADSLSIVSGVEDFDTTIALDEAGVGAGMSARGKVDVRVQSTLSGGVSAFSGASLSTTSTGFIQLSSPNFDVESYVAYVRARSDTYVSFRVYGDPATFTISGSQSGNPNGFYVWIFGPGGTHYECHGDDGPCAIGGSGPLPPGTYSFTLVYHKFSRIGWCEDCEGQSSGTVDAGGSLAATLSLSH